MSTPEALNPADEEIYEIRFGTITLIPLGAEEEAGIRIAAGRRFSFGIESPAPPGLQAPHGPERIRQKALVAASWVW